MTTTEDLWGAYITSVSVDLADRRVVIALTLDEGAKRRTASLVLEGVTDLQVHRPSEGWETVELTEAHIRDTTPVRVELVLWTEPNGIVASCASAEIVDP
ncbi:MAG: hypothetical protein ACOYXM_06100 [Actinomycetota bacterium]